MRQKDQLPFGIGRQERNAVLGVIHGDAQPLFDIPGCLRSKDSYKFAGIGPGGMGRPAIKGAGVDDIHGGLFGRFVDGYVAHIIAVGGKQGERTVARLKLEGRSQPRIDRRDDPAGKYSDWNGLQHFHRRSLIASYVSKTTGYQ